MNCVKFKHNIVVKDFSSVVKEILFEDNGSAIVSFLSGTYGLIVASDFDKNFRQPTFGPK